MAKMKCVKVKGAELNLWSSEEKFPQAHLEGNLTFVTMLTIFMACRILKRFSYIIQVEFNPTWQPLCAGEPMPRGRRWWRQGRVRWGEARGRGGGEGMMGTKEVKEEETKGRRLRKGRRRCAPWSPSPPPHTDVDSPSWTFFCVQSFFYFCKNFVKLLKTWRCIVCKV